MKQARILVLRGGAIGDFIVTLPALQALRERWPDGYIELIGYPHVAQLAEIAGIVNKVESLDRAGIARLFALRFLLTDEQCDYFRSFDIILNYLYDPDGSVAENLRQTGAQLVLHHEPFVTQLHAVDHFLKPLERLAIYSAGNAPKLRLIAEKPPHPFAAFHPGSGSPKKNWPAENFIAPARKIETRAVFIIGEADEDAERILRREIPDAEIWKQLPLPKLAARLSTATLYIGNDSGISHLAAALGVPTLVLFGPSDPNLWSPRGARVKVIQAPARDLARLDPDTVLAATAEV